MYFILRVGRRTRKNSPPDRGVGNTADVLIKACAPSPMTSPLSWTREPDQERDLDPSDPHIHCPLCGWSPRKEDRWGTHSRREECAPHACTSGLKPSAYRAAAGRRIRIGMRSDPPCTMMRYQLISERTSMLNCREDSEARDASHCAGARTTPTVVFDVLEKEITAHHFGNTDRVRGIDDLR